MLQLLVTFVFLRVFISSLALAADLFPISVNPDRQRLVDSLGREMFFHGTNIVVKQFPWHPETEGFSDGTFSEKDMQLLKSLGLNVVRLGFMWPGLEPTRGHQNTTKPTCRSCKRLSHSLLNTAFTFFWTCIKMHFPECCVWKAYPLGQSIQEALKASLNHCMSHSYLTPKQVCQRTKIVPSFSGRIIT